MSPEDPRHGSRRGYYAHRKAGEDACDACKRGAADAEARYAQNRYLGRPGRVPAIGTQRRLRALNALGWTWQAIGTELDTSRSAVEKWANEERRYMYASTATRVATLYERLCMTRPEGWIADRTRTAAKAKGYAPPLAYDDIDHDAYPCGVEVEEGGIDPVVVARLLAGERIDSTRAEKVEALRKWMADGGSQREFCLMHGWKQGRYIEREVAA